MPDILVIPTKLFHETGYFEGFQPEAGDHTSVLLNPENAQWHDREEMEENPEFKQLIPYVLFNFEDRIFSYCRKRGGEKRLDDLFSIGIGGHIERQDGEDGAFFAGLAREIHEEVEILSLFETQVIGLLNDDSNSVGRVHLGVVCLAILSDDQIASREDEIAGGCLISIDSLKTGREVYEPWSQLLIDQLPGLVDKYKAVK